MPKSARRQFLCSIQYVSGFWATKTGGNTTAATRKIYDGGSLTPDIMSDPPEHDDMTLTRPYDPARDQELVRALRKNVGAAYYNIKQQPTDASLVATAKAEDFLGLLIGVNAPDLDAASGEAATIELRFGIQRVT